MRVYKFFFRVVLDSLRRPRYTDKKGALNHKISQKKKYVIMNDITSIKIEHTDQIGQSSVRSRSEQQKSTQLFQNIYISKSQN